MKLNAIYLFLSETKKLLISPRMIAFAGGATCRERAAQTCWSRRSCLTLTWTRAAAQTTTAMQSPITWCAPDTRRVAPTPVRYVPTLFGECCISPNMKSMRGLPVHRSASYCRETRVARCNLRKWMEPTRWTASRAGARAARVCRSICWNYTVQCKELD